MVCIAVMRGLVVGIEALLIYLFIYLLNDTEVLVFKPGVVDSNPACLSVNVGSLDEDLITSWIVEVEETIKK